jgi:hypothetical protein
MDPWRIHEERWFSDGTPTALVRDGEAEAHDPPPDEPAPEPLVEAPVKGKVRGGEDLRRAGDAEPTSMKERATDAAFGTFISPGH